MPVNPADACHCYLHDESGDANWWEGHISQKDHLHQSTRLLCKDCNALIEEPTDYTGKLHNGAFHPDYCTDCKKRLGLKNANK